MLFFGSASILWIVILFWLKSAGFAAALAYSRGRSALGWLLSGILFGPFSLLVVPRLHHHRMASRWT